MLPQLLQKKEKEIKEEEEEEEEEKEKEEEDEEEKQFLDTLPPPAHPAAGVASDSARNIHHDTDSHTKRLTVGILSSDFGVHPVATLVRGFIDKINITKIELFAFSLKKEMSWWGRNISNSIENFIFLPQINTRDAAAVIAAYDIEILIDLNGHTQFSGMQIMSHQPAPVQGRCTKCSLRLIYMCCSLCVQGKSVPLKYCMSCIWCTL